MRTFLIVLVAVVILGGGWYWYSQQSATSVEDTGVKVDANSPTELITNPGPTTPATGTGVTKEFTVSGQNFSFSSAAMTVNKGDIVKITFKNISGTHDLVVDGYNVRTKTLQGGTEETITFVADKAGSFEYYCSIGQHRSMGMKGTLTVTP